MTSSITYAGTIITASSDLPAENTQTGFEAVSFIDAACTLKSVPGILRDWVKVTDDLVCAETNVDIKGSSKWTPVSFTMSRRPGDGLQDLLISLENSRTAKGSFKLQMPGNGGTIYFTGQVSKFSLADGGSKDTIHTSSVELLIQTQPVFAPAS